MEELLSTNDAVLISYAETLLRDAGIDFLVTDQNMSVMEGSLGVLPRRLLVPPASAKQARQLVAGKTGLMHRFAHCKISITLLHGEVLV
jgi:hypothetical protein